tara:strand:+ start:1538 stop:2629 length:1092 start_codon:yes stop_codon:yes gene_type:complete
MSARAVRGGVIGQQRQLSRRHNPRTIDLPFPQATTGVSANPTQILSVMKTMKDLPFPVTAPVPSAPPIDLPFKNAVNPPRSVRIAADAAVTNDEQPSWKDFVGINGQLKEEYLKQWPSTVNKGRVDRETGERIPPKVDMKTDAILRLSKSKTATETSSIVRTVMERLLKIFPEITKRQVAQHVDSLQLQQKLETDVTAAVDEALGDIFNDSWEETLKDVVGSAITQLLEDEDDNILKTKTLPAPTSSSYFAYATVAVTSLHVFAEHTHESAPIHTFNQYDVALVMYPMWKNEEENGNVWMQVRLVDKDTCAIKTGWVMVYHFDNNVYTLHSYRNVPDMVNDDFLEGDSAHSSSESSSGSGSLY